MPYQDNFLMLSDEQALTASADSTNVVDLGIDDRKIGVGEQMCVAFAVNVAADSTTGDETYQFNVSTGTTSALGTAVVSKTVAAADLAADDTFMIPIDHEAAKRYIGVEYVLGGTTPSVTITADVRPASMVSGLANYESGYSIT